MMLMVYSCRVAAGTSSDASAVKGEASTSIGGQLRAEVAYKRLVGPHFPYSFSSSGFA